MRSTTDRKISGVAGGLAQYLGMDPTLVRVLWVLAIAIPGGIGLLPYIALWIVLPEDDGRASSAYDIAERRYAQGEITAEDLSQIKEDLR